MCLHVSNNTDRYAAYCEAAVALVTHTYTHTQKHTHANKHKHVSLCSVILKLPSLPSLIRTASTEVDIGGLLHVLLPEMVKHIARGDRYACVVCVYVFFCGYVYCLWIDDYDQCMFSVTCVLCVWNIGTYVYTYGRMCAMCVCVHAYTHSCAAELHEMHA